jgi:hypothetical protein
MSFVTLRPPPVTQFVPGEHRRSKSNALLDPAR